MTVRAVDVFGGWREALWFYQAIGLGIALWFWWIFRERPEDHPRVNATERELIERSLPRTVSAGHGKAKAIPIGAIMGSPSLWCLSVAMFCTNIGWALLWPLGCQTYFKNVHGASRPQSVPPA